tara:strand:+ start:101 stop:295 length:195 start_codon:yes stop_codon:yes gene_type:complete
MNEKQINYELAKRKKDLAWWVEHLQTRVHSIEGKSVADLQIRWHRDRISQLKRMRFDLQQKEPI